MKRTMYIKVLEYAWRRVCIFETVFVGERQGWLLNSGGWGVSIRGWDFTAEDNWQRRKGEH